MENNVDPSKTETNILDGVKLEQEFIENELDILDKAEFEFEKKYESCEDLNYLKIEDEDNEFYTDDDSLSKQNSDIYFNSESEFIEEVEKNKNCNETDVTVSNTNSVKQIKYFNAENNKTNETSGDLQNSTFEGITISDEEIEVDNLEIVSNRKSANLKQDSLSKSKNSLPVSAKQIAILLRFIKCTNYKPNIGNKLWNNIAKKLNDEGPSIKSPDSWKTWFFKYKSYLRKKTESIPLRVSNSIPVSEKQLSMIIKSTPEKAKSQHENGFWKTMSKILNNEGPSIKKDVDWKNWYKSYKISLKNRIESGAKLKPLEEKITFHDSKYSRHIPAPVQQESVRNYSRILVSPKQISIMLQSVDTFWKNMSKKLNCEGPWAMNPISWQNWFLNYRIRQRKNGVWPTPITKKLCNFKKTQIQPRPDKRCAISTLELTSDSSEECEEPKNKKFPPIIHQTTTDRDPMCIDKVVETNQALPQKVRDPICTDEEIEIIND